MFEMMNLALIVAAYLIGSVPSSVWIGRLFYNTDVRMHGSGNAGATNTFRVLGNKAGILVFVIDLMKGFAAARLAFLNTSLTAGAPEYLITIQLVLGIAAILGHIFPLYAGFNGGKGVATLFGAILAISFFPTLIMAGIFFATLFGTRYVSLSSILAGISFPLLIILVFDINTQSLIIFSVMIPILIIITHQKNIGRLLRNEESKADLSKFNLHSSRNR
jgi:glycerol-3-phosphate acyltransferase PlsY